MCWISGKCQSVHEVTIRSSGLSSIFSIQECILQKVHIISARQALGHAKAANSDMRNAKSVADFFRHWSSFLTEFYTVYNRLHYAVTQGGSAEEKAWNKQIETERYADPLLSYLTIARQVKDKTATVSVGITPPMFAGMSLVPDGSNVPLAQIGMSNGWQVTPLPVCSGGRSANSPDQHKGKLLQAGWHCVSWWDVLDVAMNSLDQMINEAESLFVLEQPAG